MLHFPNNINEALLQEQIIPVSNSDGSINYYQWGINARILFKDDVVRAEQILDDEALSSIEWDLFWEGFYYGIEHVIEKITVKKAA